MPNSTNHLIAFLKEQGRQALVSTLMLSTLGISVYLLAEPVVGRSAVVPGPVTFTINQTITDESGFLVSPANVTMSSPINGVTGGSATGTTYFVVQTNNTAGYSVDITFPTNGTENAMIGDVSGGTGIRDHREGGTFEPTFNFDNASSAAQFGYTVNSSSSNETASAFLYDGGDICDNGGTNETFGFCWMTPSTSAYTIVDKGGPSADGATTTIAFRVVVPSNPVPAVAAEEYTATATLSLITN